VSLVLLLVVLAVIAGIALVAAGRGGSLPEVEPDRSPRGRLPSGDITREQVDGLRFTLALRGYRMDEVDEVLDRLVDEIEARDARIAELEHGTIDPGVGRAQDG
jgi:DivIVA domain-containing protein